MKKLNIMMGQLDVIPARPYENYANIVELVISAVNEKTDILVLPELCLSGYLIGDLYEEESFIYDCMTYGDKVANLTANNKLSIIFGNIKAIPNEKHTDGRMLKYNAVFVASGGKFQDLMFIDTDHDVFCGSGNLTAFNFQPKLLLPNYREFEEPRHFSALGKLCDRYDTSIDNTLTPITINGVKIGLTICEDGWDDDYDIKPIDVLVNNGAELILNLSCSPFTLGKNKSRNRVFGGHAKKHKIPVIYVNAIGLQNNGKTIFTFDGSSVAYDKNGAIVYQCKSFVEAIQLIEYVDGNIAPVYSNQLVSDDGIQDENDIVMIHDALIYGIRKYMRMSGLRKVVIGSSGGIDSAVSAALYVEAIGADNVHLVNMPSKFNSNTTISLAQQLADNLGCWYTTVPISESVELTTKQITQCGMHRLRHKPFNLRLSDFNLENVQARDRSSRILAAIASSVGGVFTNNGNKTESTVGYCVMPNMGIWTNKGFKTIGDVMVGESHGINNHVLQTVKSRKQGKYIIQNVIGNTIECSADHLVKCIDTTTGIEFFKVTSKLTTDDVIACSVGNNIFGDVTVIDTFTYNKPKWDFRSNDIKFPTVLDLDTSKFLGMCIADGSYGTTNVYTITTTKSYVYDFIRSYLLTCNIPSESMCKRTTDKYDMLGVRICSSQFTAWLKWIGILNGAGKKQIPDIIKTTTRENILSFISGIMLDSSTNLKTNELREFCYHSASYDLAYFVQQSMLNLGILCYLKQYDAHKGHLIQYEVYIPSIESNKLLSILPVKHQIAMRIDKNIKLRKHTKGAFDYVYGHKEIRILLTRYFERNRNVVRSLMHEKNRVCRATAEKWAFHPLLDNLTDTRVDIDLLTKFRNDIKSTTRYFKINDIKYEDGLFDMVDISLSSVNEFVINGMIVHNCTILGDHAGFLATIGDLWKEQVYQLGSYINNKSEKIIIPQGIFSVVPSAELSDKQNVDEGKGDPLIYWLHDRLFKAFVEKWNRATPESILTHYANGTIQTYLELPYPIDSIFDNADAFISDLERWWNLFKGMAVAKRVQAPPVLAVSRRAFGFDYRESLNCVYYSIGYKNLKEKLLNGDE